MNICTSVATPTRAEVEALKRNWISDPCWDIYNTEGFEVYEAELRQFQSEREAMWKKARHDELLKKADDLGISGNVKLAAYIERLEDRVVYLENKEAAG